MRPPVRPGSEARIAYGFLNRGLDPATERLPLVWAFNSRRVVAAVGYVDCSALTRTDSTVGITKSPAAKGSRASVPASSCGIERSEIGERAWGERTGPIRRARQVVVVRCDQDVVAGDSNIGIDDIDTVAHRRTHRRHHVELGRKQVLLLWAMTSGLDPSYGFGGQAMCR